MLHGEENVFSKTMSIWGLVTSRRDSYCTPNEERCECARQSLLPEARFGEKHYAEARGVLKERRTLSAMLLRVKTVVWIEDDIVPQFPPKLGVNLPCIAGSSLGWPLLQQSLNPQDFFSIMLFFLDV